MGKRFDAKGIPATLEGLRQENAEFRETINRWHRRIADLEAKLREAEAREAANAHRVLEYGVEVVGSTGAPFVATFAYRDMAERWAQANYPGRFRIHRDPPPAALSLPASDHDAHGYAAGHESQQRADEALRELDHDARVRREALEEAAKLAAEDWRARNAGYAAVQAGLHDPGDGLLAERIRALAAETKETT